MGICLNSKMPFDNYAKMAASAYFVDKSLLLQELIPIVEDPMAVLQGNDLSRGGDIRYVCITRPRRFGKTVMAHMIASFFGKNTKSRELFANLAIGSHPRFDAHAGRHNVIFLSLNEMPRNCRSYERFIDRVQDRLLYDLKESFPDVPVTDDIPVWDAMRLIYEQNEDARFIFVLDEWDFIFHRNFITEQDRIDYVTFLSNLLKDQPYVEMAYMTGILPIAKYSSGSELNMFCEYTMANEEKFSDCFGFTEEEVDRLYAIYERQIKGARSCAAQGSGKTDICRKTSCREEETGSADREKNVLKKQRVTREGLRIWYDGYHTKAGIRVYNPRSVVYALSNNNLGSYWTSSGPYDEIFFYTEKNIDAVRDDLALMIAGTPVRANVREYAASSMELVTRDEIFSAMVVYGFLNYDDGFISIPNRELMDKFEDMVKKEKSLGYIHRLAASSQRMLFATLQGDTGTMETILSYVHDTESPLLMYSHETELSVVVNLAYLSARDTYRVEREDKAGTGFVDFIFYPRRPSDDCIILELKVDDTPRNAIRQIKEKKYALAFKGKTAESAPYTGRILAVGIGYSKKDKVHHCLVEELPD